MKIVTEEPHPDQSAISAPALSVVVSVSDQMLRVLRGGDIKAEYPVSTSRYGIGSEEGSYKTPVGRFRIFDKVGDGAPAGAVFVGRQATGEIAPQGGEADHILTRILWLDGCDLTNANTRDRYIYLHGTNQEALIGKPASHGCIRLRANDIIELYEKLDRGTPVEIII